MAGSIILNRPVQTPSSCPSPVLSLSNCVPDWNATKRRVWIAMRQPLWLAEPGYDNQFDWLTLDVKPTMAGWLSSQLARITWNVGLLHTTLWQHLEATAGHIRRHHSAVVRKAMVSRALSYFRSLTLFASAVFD